MEDVKDSKLRRFCSKNILIILGFSSIIAVIALIAVGLTQNKPLPENMKPGPHPRPIKLHIWRMKQASVVFEALQYGIVLDAGSSHTTLYIYKWPGEKENDTGVVNQLEECKVKGPGISQYANKTHEISIYLTACMERAKEVIPKSQYQETPVYLGATAGMRLLRIENEGLADNVLIAVTQSLSKYSFNFQGARVISGREEGAYGWITINYLLGKFTKKSRWFNLMTNESDSQETYGALDLGGASTQITFVPQNQTIESPQNALYFRLYGKNYNVYTQSFLCYGKDQALLQKLAKDIRETDKILRDPCFNHGYNRVMNISDLRDSPCTKKYKKILEFQQLQIQGTGNFQQCQQSIFQLFNTSNCPYSHCSFDKIFLPPLRGHFGAFSAYYYVMKFLNLTSEEPYSQEKVIDTVEKFCSLPWEELKRNFGEVHEKYLSEYCFSGTYIISLLQRAYHITPDFWKNIHFMGKIQNSDVGWTLGYMLNLTNRIPAEQPLSAPLSYSTYVFLMVLFSLILVAVVITSLLVFHQPSYFWKDVV